MFKAIISGVIGSDATIRNTTDYQIIDFSVAASKKKVKDQEVTTWVKCQKWVKSGGSVGIFDYLKKGIKVSVSGACTMDTYINKDGVEKSTIVLSVDDIDIHTYLQDKPAQTNPEHSRPVQPQKPQPTEFDEQLGF